MKEKNVRKGISLIVLVITIIVLVILATAVLFTLIRNNPLENAKKATLQNDLKTFKEELELFKAEKELESKGAFDPRSLEANRVDYTYNTKPKNEVGNVNTIITTLEGSKYDGKIKVFEGELMFVSKDKKEIDWAAELGIPVNNFYVVDGILKSVISNDLVVDEAGKLTTIPSNVREIAEGAFYNISGLKEVVIPGTVKVIGKKAFGGNKELTKLTIENGVEVIGFNAFDGCSALTTINVPDSVTEIKGWAFANCINLKNIQLSKNITYIGSYLFYQNVNLENIEIPNKVTKIYGSSFYACRKLTTINIPASVTSIDSCFYGCDLLTNINIDAQNDSYKFENAILMSKDNTRIIDIFPGALTSSTLVIPEGITGLQTGIMPTNTIITRIEIPSSATSISAYTFSRCLNLQEIIVSDTNANYQSINGSLYSKSGETLYFWTDRATSITVPEGIKKIDSHTFSLCKDTTNISFPSTLTTLGNQALSGLSKVTSVDIGPSVSNIHPLALYNTGIKQVNISPANDYYTFVDNAMFSKDMKTLVALLVNIESYEIPNGVEKIGDYAFHAKTKLKNVIIPNTVKSIGQSFNHCTELENIDIPSSVEKINVNCFVNSNKLKKVYIHKNKDSITGMPWGIAYGEKAIFWLGK